VTGLQIWFNGLNDLLILLVYLGRKLTKFIIHFIYRQIGRPLLLPVLPKETDFIEMLDYL